MRDFKVLEMLRAEGRLNPGQVSLWRDAAELLAALDAVGREGASVVIKVDGGREGGRFYTVVISGGKLGDDFFHKDAADLHALLEEAVQFYQSYQSKVRSSL